MSIGTTTIDQHATGRPTSVADLDLPPRCSAKVFSHSSRRLLAIVSDASTEKTGELVWWRGSARSTSMSSSDVARVRHSGRSQTLGRRRRRSRPAPPACRCACCWPKPRRNQASTSSRVGRRHERVVPRAPLLDPAGGGMRVQVADELRLAHRMPGELDPRVRAPALVQPRREQVAVLREDARRAVLLPQRTHLCPVVDLAGEQRLGLSVPPVPLLEQRCGRLDVLLGERDDLHASTSRSRSA